MTDAPPNTNVIAFDRHVCLVCDKLGPKPLAPGWRLAPNRIGGYVCSAKCDEVIVTYDKNQKDQKRKK